MSNVKLYSGDIEVSKRDTKILKRIFVNHLLIYNYSLSVLFNAPEMRFETLNKKVIEYIAEKDIKPILKTAVHNEIYYQFKKFKRNVRVQKHLTDLQYFTFVVSSYNNNSFNVNEERNCIYLNGLDTGVELKLHDSLPEQGESKTLYFNISYSSLEDRFMLSLYGS